MLEIETKKRVRLSKTARKARGPIKLVEEPCHVRTATKEDLFGLLEMLRMVHKEIGLFNFNEAKAAETIWPALHQQGGIIGVIGKHDNLEGFAFLSVSHLWYSDASVLEEKCVFVKPEYRLAKESRAQKLLSFAKKCAADLNLPLMIGVLSNSKTNAKVGLYERHFGNPAGAFFLWGAKTGAEGQN